MSAGARRGVIPRRVMLLGAGATALVARSGPARAVAGLLRVVAPWDWPSPDPAETGYVMTRTGVAETLLGVTADGELVGQVAETWDLDPDRLTWRFRIRPGLLFHDGTPVTAATVANSLRAAFVGESLSAVPLEAVTGVDDVVVIRTRTPFAPLPAFLVDYAAIILSPACYGADGRVQSIAGTGPYRLMSGTRTELDLAAFAAFRGPAPIVPRARYTAVANGDTRANIAVAGDADLVFTLPPQAASRIDASGRMRVSRTVIPRLRFLTLNAGLPQFADVRVRQALSLAIDRAGIAAGILRHPPSAATQLMPPVLAEWHDPALPPLRTDPAAARALLEAAGWVIGPDGARSKAGVRLAATLITAANRPELPPMAAAVQAQLAAVGMAVSIEVGPAVALPEAIRAGTMQMALIARTYVNVPDPIATIIPDYTREQSVWGAVGWDGRDGMRALTDEYVACFDAARRATLRRAITALVHDQMPVIPVSWFEHTVAVGLGATGVVIDPYETTYGLQRVGLG